MADRDREAAEDGAAIWRVFPKTLAEIVASERAAATAACAEVCGQRAAKYTATAIELEKLGHAETGEEVRLEARMARECESAIRALSPEGWVGVRRDTLADLRVLAEVVLRVRDEGGTRYSPTDDFVADLRAALEATR